jgi:cytoskeletal protein CcmA (bactofilin family)
MALFLAGLIVLLVAGSALAAEMAGGDTYRLPAGDVIADDFYVAGGEVIIDGTVQGDLVVAGGYVEINGTVTEDLIAAGGSVVVNGRVEDDARIAGGGIVIAGSIGDDLLVAGGGGPGMQFIPMGPGTRSVAPGVRLAPSSSVGGDAYLVGGQGSIAGTIGGDLFAGMGTLAFSGQVDGDATLNAETLTVDDSAQVGGALTYASPNPLTVPPGAAATVTQRTWEQEIEPEREGSVVVDIFWWLLRTTLIIVGLGLLGWLLLAFAPAVLPEAAEAIARRPAESGIYGLVIAALAVPVFAALVFAASIFWGFLPGGAGALAFLYGGLTLLWIASPLVTGLWLGQQILSRAGRQSTPLVALLVGTVLIVVIARLLALIPCLGILTYGVIYLASFALAAGGLLLSRRTAAPPAPEPLTGDMGADI